MRVAVIGGTPEALVAALAMSRRGMDVTVYVEDARQRGMGAVLGPDARAVLAALDVRVPGERLLGERLGVLRDDLLDALRAALPDDHLRSGRFEGLSLDGHVRVDGRTLGADVYVGADGAGSPVRRAVFPDAEPTLQMMEVECLFGRGAALDPAPGLDVVPVGGGRVVCTLRSAQTTGERSTPETDIGQMSPTHLMTPTAALDARIWHTAAFVPPRTCEGHLVLVGDAAEPRGAFTGAELDASIRDAVQVAEALARTQEHGAALAAV